MPPTSSLLEKLRVKTRIIDEDYVVRWAVKEKLGPFLSLVAVILSQNTSDKNALTSLKIMLDKGLTSPQTLLHAPDNELLQALRPAGLHNQRLRTLRRLSQVIIEEGLDLQALCREPTEKALQKLTSLRGIGVKTAEVFLSAYCGHPTFPIDRHIMRITQRVTGRRMSYRAASDFWKKVFPPEHYREAHLRLIDVGRKYCRPREPRCRECPLNEACSYASREGGGHGAPDSN